MRKIYLSSFNKFAIFVLYGLLSITVIVLAQDDGGTLFNDCVPKPMVPKTPQLIIGYIQLFTEQPSKIKPTNIPWDLYDYINVIGKKNKGSLSHLIYYKLECFT
jgi:hypothetical protein